ncbi:MAG: galactose-1-phosphate uridylyltransferase [bacterium]
MPEIRQNLATREWVVIATERAVRPEDFKSKERAKTEARPARVEACPFCPGNESKTPDELFRVESGGGGWSVRVIPNKFAALKTEGERMRRIDGVERVMAGIGYHEVIVEDPVHNTTIALLPRESVANVLTAYRERHLAIAGDRRMELVIIFKNHGAAAGTSLEHPHSQLIALPVVPSQIRHRMQDAIVFHDDYGECVYCRMLRDELAAKTRIVAESERFAAFVLYAAASPFHTWILPRRHAASFGTIGDEEIADLASVLRATLRKLYVGLGDPDYNFVVRSAPIGLENATYFHWYIAIVPRLSKAAGFELGSGMFINTALPEDSAAFMRKVEG